MTDHHPDAAEVLMFALDRDHVGNGFVLGRVEQAENKRIAALLCSALSAAGLAVVKVGEPPPWMEQPWASAAVGTKRITTWFTPDDPTGSFQTRVEGDEPDGARPLYVIKEQDRD